MTHFICNRKQIIKALIQGEIAHESSLSEEKLPTKKIIVNIIKDLPCNSSSKCFTCITSITPSTNSIRWQYFYPHFVSKKTETESQTVNDVKGNQK